MMSRRSRWWLAGVVVVVLVAGIVGGVVWVRRARPEAAPVTVVLQAATDPGVDSFVPVVSSRPVAPALPPSGVAAGVTVTVDADSGVRVVSGTTDRLYAGVRSGSPELYGGSGSLSACDPAAIAEFLAAHPEKAAAWAGVRGIGSDAIPGYLGSLTPVVLVHDTVVTNHGFAGGAATAFVSVLQAGTAVLVDATGLPVVRCACGNPLSAPPRVDLSAVDVQGARWDGYDPAAAVTVVPGSAVAQFVVVDVVTGQDVTVAVGPRASATTSALSVSATATPAAHAGPCTFALTWPDAGPGWIDPLGGDLTCQQMIDQWRRYEQWTGERGGSLQLVDFGDGWNCRNSHLEQNQWPLAVGLCASGNIGFRVQKGVPSSAGVSAAGTPTSAAASAPTPVSATGSVESSPGQPAASAVSDVLITPSGNIECAVRNGQFACTIKEFNGDLGDERCPGKRGAIVRLDPTGPIHVSSCQGDFFDGISWPAPTPYGTTTKLGDITCDVEETGLTCTNLDGHTFTLSRAGLR
ncbi:DUF6777 domain-containing protein [Nakamurella sp.]|uniref:DUF6777 domain-containing protein n=1 Tax=Nakamurella sp. TaxID=1869182 RepID=UPI003783467A